MKQKTIICRVTDREKRTLERRAETGHETVSDVIRRAVGLTSGQKRWRRFKKLTQADRDYARKSKRSNADLARELGVSVSTISRVRRS